MSFLFDPYSPAVDTDPFPFYKILRDDYPCFWSSEANTWIPSRYADIIAALNDWRTFSSASGKLMTELPNRAGSTLGTTDPPRHDRLRALVQHAFLKRNLEALADPMRAIARDAVAALRDAKHFDFIQDFSSKFTVRVLFAALGLPLGDEETVREKAVLMVQSDPHTRAKGPEHLAAYNWMQEYAGKVIAERRKNPQNDLISHFSQAEIDGDKLDDREVLHTTATLIMAGIESLGGFMAMFALNMADFHDARRRVAADSARLAYGAGNRDERQFPNPDLYDIECKPKGHLGFGGGVHACLGGAIARMAIKIAFEEFLPSFPQIHRVQEQLPWLPSSTFRSPMRLELALG